MLTFGRGERGWLGRGFFLGGDRFLTGDQEENKRGTAKVEGRSEKKAD